MRDALLIVVIIAGSLVALRRPWIGVVMWTWVSLMNPHESFGWLAAKWPVASMVAASTMIGLLLTRDRQSPMVGPPVLALLAFTIWICITLPFSIYLDASLPLWERSMKIFVMVFVTLALVTDERKLRVLIWTMVASVAFYGLKGGVFTLLTGGNFRVWGPGGFIGGNNEVALALTMTIPLMRYLQLQMVGHWQRRAMALAMLLCAITVLGTHSRGAFLALGAMAFFLWLKGGNKVMAGLVLVAIGVAILSFMPEQWWDRMATIQTYDLDNSALGRINAWRMAWNLALDRLMGGGFMIYEPGVFAMYAPDPGGVHAAHSIYFQVLGEHGFIGLLLFLLIGFLTWVTARRLVQAAELDASAKWAGDLGAMVQVSMVGYATAGAFLSLSYYDLPYDIMAAAVLALHFIRKKSLAVRALPDPVATLRAKQRQNPAA